MKHGHFHLLLLSGGRNRSFAPPEIPQWNLQIDTAASMLSRFKLISLRSILRLADIRDRSSTFQLNRLDRELRDLRDESGDL